MTSADEAHEKAVWRGLAILRTAERASWRTGFAWGLVTGAAAFLVGEVVAMLLRHAS